MKKENWSIGKRGAILTDTPKGFAISNKYGGTPVCENVCREKDLHLISASPDMLEALEKVLEESTVFGIYKIPAVTLSLINDAIKKAKGE